jgi:predicted Zn-dependent protease
MQMIVKKNKFTVPIIFIRGTLYLIGDSRFNCELKVDAVFIKSSAGAGSVPQPFEKFVKMHQSEMKNNLCENML